MSGVLRILLGLSACPALAGCVTDAAGVAGLPAGTGAISSAAGSGDSLPSTLASGEPTDEKTSALVAKARALAFADPGAAKPPEQIDLAALAMRSNPNATRRLDGPSAPGPTSDSLSSEEVMQRLRQLSHNSGAPAQDGSSPNILARLQALSHRPAPADAVTEIQPAAARAAGPAKPVSPEAIMRRMKELSGSKPDAAAPAGAGGPQDGRKPDADAFGGLAAVVPAPDMARTPAVERAIRSAPGAAQ